MPAAVRKRLHPRRFGERVVRCTRHRDEDLGGLARDPARRAEVKRMTAVGKRAIYRDRTTIAALEELLETVARAQAK
jgi:hypothetical protein